MTTDDLRDVRALIATWVDSAKLSKIRAREESGYMVHRCEAYADGKEECASDLRAALAIVFEAGHSKAAEDDLHAERALMADIDARLSKLRFDQVMGEQMFGSGGAASFDADITFLTAVKKALLAAQETTEPGQSTMPRCS